MRILLAVDASPDSRNAAGMIRHFSEPPTLDVLNVVDEDALRHAYISPDMPAACLEAYRKEVSEAAERVLHEMGRDLEGRCRQLRLIADVGDAAESIIATAEEARSDLIIVGQRGMTATPSFLLGGVSQKVATYAPCSVLVVKETPATLDRLVVAIDGSGPSLRTIALLAPGPFRGRVHVTVVTVWPQRPLEAIGVRAGAAGSSDFGAFVEKKGEELLDRVAEQLRRGPYEIATELLHGDPALAVLDSAVRHEAQMIVVGSRGATAIKRLLLGSVSQKVLVYAACSVLIVR
ncbi:universal stress protein [Nitrospira sp. Kam-Ns4a]